MLLEGGEGDESPIPGLTSCDFRDLSNSAVLTTCPPLIALRLKQRHRGYGDTFYPDEVFLKINGKQQYLWRVLG